MDTIQAENQIHRANSKPAPVDVKTDAGRRSLPLLRWARDAPLDRAQWQANRKRRRGADWMENGLILTTSAGNAIQPRNFSRTSERLVKAAKMRLIRLHDLRHSVASLLKREGAHHATPWRSSGISVSRSPWRSTRRADKETRRQGLGPLGGALFGKTVN
ncbi:hypothetical protein GCM10009799_48790 [Nocardiopsis rhodophaea]|uniref:Tyr recombinase domain-containing protein n=1 Tax=Nocardiopsis rhodophaea TaxID=280238 RepID=A0ABN2TN80_9ACTN